MSNQVHQCPKCGGRLLRPFGVVNFVHCWNCNKDYDLNVLENTPEQPDASLITPEKWQAVFNDSYLYAR